MSSSVLESKPVISLPQIGRGFYTLFNAYNLSGYYYRISITSSVDKACIFKIRHYIYAKELNQHQENQLQLLTDDLDSVNHYIVAKVENEVIGFISITSLTSIKYSIDKYFSKSSK